MEKTHDSKFLMETWEYNLYAVLLFLIGFLGFNFNLISLTLICKNKLWSPINIIILNLLFSDFLVSFLGTPWTFFAAVYKGWPFGRNICIAYGFLMGVCGISSITSLTVLAVERFCLIVFPLGKQLTTKVAVFGVMFIWTYSIVLTIPPIFGWGEYSNEAANISCSVNWESHEHNSTSYIIFLAFFGFVVPLFVILYSYGNIIFKINRNFSRKKNRSEKRVTFMIGLMITTFLLAWTPYAIYALIEQFSSMEISPNMEVIPAVFAKSSIVYNPIIYVTLNKQLLAHFATKPTKLLRPHNTSTDYQPRP
uniref:G-protein coupled receptors family 1 profile domain-containing protein n=1 Tax=Megaselia scalaris TaxID=36166 RepID=T1GU18_MEGSC